VTGAAAISKFLRAVVVQDEELVPGVLHVVVHALSRGATTVNASSGVAASSIQNSLVSTLALRISR